MNEKNTKIKSGFIFKEKYGIDPRTLTLEEINKKVFQDRKPTISSKHSRLVAARGSVFRFRTYSDADTLVDLVLR